jgi:hypothetical protein
MATKKAKAPVKVSAPVGRPTLYKPEYCELAYKFCLLGASNAKLAELFEVAGSTIDKWIAEIPEFSGAVREGREIADANVAKSLYHRAVGYSHNEDDIKMFQGQIIITPTTKHYPPDTGAATMWLKNRQGDKWRDKQDVEHSGAVGVSLITDEQARRIAEEILRDD